jgi:hypothetical protein
MLRSLGAWIVFSGVGGAVAVVALSFCPSLAPCAAPLQCASHKRFTMLQVYKESDSRALAGALQGCRRRDLLGWCPVRVSLWAGCLTSATAPWIEMGPVRYITHHAAVGQSIATMLSNQTTWGPVRPWMSRLASNPATSRRSCEISRGLRGKLESHARAWCPSRALRLLVGQELCDYVKSFQTEAAVSFCPGIRNSRWTAPVLDRRL